MIKRADFAKELLFVNFVFLIAVFGLGGVSAVTITVCSSGCNNSTIQDAINFASAGDTINVGVGTYAESILINKYLILIGEDGAMISGDDSLYNYIVKINSDGVVFDNFEVNGGGSGTGDNNFDYGIWIDNAENVEVSNSVIKNIWENSGNGIQVDDSSNSDIHNNTISLFHKRGIRYVNSEGTFYNNDVFGENVSGVDRVQNLVNLWTGSNVEIYNNKLHNALTSIGSTPLWDSPAIFVSSYYGGYIDSGSSYANIHDNEIYNGDTGIVITSVYSSTDTSSANIINNNLHNLAEAINFEKDTGTALINNNTFLDNTHNINYLGTNLLDTTNNWWGSTLQSVIASLVSGNADYTPWAYAEDLYDNIKPTTVINSPVVSSWQKAPSFQIDVSDSDTGGAGLFKCYYRVYNDINGDGDENDAGELIRDWTERTCNNQLTVTAGMGQDCRTEGIDRCKIQVKAIDNSGNDNWNPPWPSRKFSIDWTAPAITSLQNYIADGTINNDNNVTISARVSDGNSGINKVWLNIIWGNLTSDNYTLSNSGDNYYNYTISSNSLNNQDNIIWKYYATDNLGNTANSSTYSFKVENRAPIFNITAGNIQNFTWIEDSGSESVYLKPYFYDLDGDEINFTSGVILSPGNTSNPLGGNITVNINNVNKNATLSSTENWNGNATITFYGVDSIGASTPSNSVYVVVIPDENEIPTLTASISPVNFSEDNFLNMNLLCNPNDPAQVCLNYRYDPMYIDYNSNLTVTVNSVTGAVGLSTNQDWNGITYIKFLADDNGVPMQTGTLILKVNVTPVNDNPLLNIPDQNVNEDSALFTLNLATYTVDIDNLVLTEISWKLMSQSNANLINCSITGSNLNCLAPSPNQAGYNNLIIEAKDNLGGTGNQIVRINVNNVNDAPIINSTFPLTYTTQEDTPLALSIYLKPYESDVDSYDVDSNLTWSVSGVDTNLFTTTINSVTDTLIVSPVANKFGGSSFTLILTDSKGATDSRTITLTITSINDLPVLDSIPSLTAIIGKLFIYNINASDIDGNPLTFSDNSSLFNIQTAGNSGIISFTPILSDYGNHLINISVSDGQGGIDFQVLNLFIDFDKTPTITSYSPANNPLIKTGNSQNFSVVAQDVDTPVLNYQWSVNGASDGVNSPSYNYNSTTAGTYEIKVVVSDGTNSASKSWTLTASSYPIATEFNGAGTTNLSNMTDFTSVSLVLENQYGKIQFLSPVNLNNAWDLNSNVEIANGVVAVNSQIYPSLNKPAKITLYGLTYNSIPKVYYTNSFTTTSSAINQECSSTQCTMINYTAFSTTNGEVLFNVSGFSSFMVKGSGLIYDLKKLDIDRCENDVQGNLTLEIKNPDEDESFTPGEEIELKVKVKNNGNEDERFIVKAVLFNVDEDDEEESEESDSIKIEADDSETFELSLVVPDDFDEENSYFLFVKAYQKGEEEIQCNYDIVDLSLEREEHKLIIEDVIAEPQIAYPNQKVNMNIVIKNVGSSEEENAYIKITNSKLNISEKSEYFDIEEYGEDDETTITESILIPYKTPEGEYSFKIEVFFEGKSNSTTETISVVNQSLVQIDSASTLHLSSAESTSSNKIYLTTSAVSSTPSDIQEIEYTFSPEEESGGLLIKILLPEEEQAYKSENIKDGSENNYFYIIAGLIAGIILFAFLIAIIRRRK